MLLPLSVCLSVCQSAGLLDYSRIMILVKLFGRLVRLDVGDNLDHSPDPGIFYRICNSRLY